VASYKAKVNINDGEKEYAPGDSISVSGDEADRLLAVDAIETAAEAKAAEKEEKKK